MNSNTTLNQESTADADKNIFIKFLTSKVIVFIVSAIISVVITFCTSQYCNILYKRYEEKHTASINFSKQNVLNIVNDEYYTVRNLLLGKLGLNDNDVRELKIFKCSISDTKKVQDYFFILQ